LLAMMILLTKLLLTGMVAASVMYYVVCIAAAVKFFSRPPLGVGLECPPASILIPLCGADYEAYENYASLCRLDYPAYEIVFGVMDAEDTSLPVVRKLMDDFSRSNIQIVVGTSVLGENPKVNNLHNMLLKAKHRHIVIVDSDIRVEPDFLARVVPPLLGDRVGLATCFYRSGKASNLPSALEAIGITGEFAPGVVVAHLFEGMTFSLGAVMATTRERLRSIGGLEAIADFLADDFMLGNLLWKAGYEIRLLPYVVETIHPHAGFASMLRHQIRWGRGIRACRPAGYWGSVITHGSAIALINTVICGGSLASWLILAATAAAQLAMGWIVGVRCLGDENLRRHIWLLPVRDLLGFFVWCCAVTGRKVEWRGKAYTLVEEGKIIPVSPGGKTIP
jgi:ceramide glucosyltransferase